MFGGASAKGRILETWHTLGYFLALVKSRNAPESNWPFTGSTGAAGIRLFLDEHISPALMAVASQIDGSLAESAIVPPKYSLLDQLGEFC
jgi:hypothetical protein